jgi:hypothetical protein
MPEPKKTDPNERVREIIQGAVTELVELGLEGGELAAVRMLARQYLGKLYLAGDLETLEDLRDEIDADLEAEDDEPPARPVLTVVN